MKLNNEKGFTLIEILAALMILGIVFISFMTIFPQMINMNDRSEKKLQTMNLAKTEVANIKNLSSELTEEKKTKNSSGPNDFETYVLPRGDDVIEVDCYNVGVQTCSGFGQNAYTRKNELYKIHIKVKIGGRIISESFGYLEIE